LNRPTALATGQAAQFYNSSADPSFQEAVGYRNSGQLAKAGAAFDRLATAARQQRDTSKEARVLLAKGGIELRQFEYTEAAQTYYKVLDLARAVPDERTMGAAYVNLAEIHIQLNDLPAAEREANSAVEILSDKQRYVDVLIRAELQLGSIMAGMGHNATSRHAYQRAIELAAGANDAANEALAWLILGQALTKTNDLQEAENAYIHAYRLDLLHHSPNVDTVRAKLAELEWLKGNAAEGLAQLDTVLAGKSPARLGFPEYQTYYCRAQMLAALSRKHEALQMYRRAVDAATSWRRRALPGEAANAASVERIHAVYADGSDYLAQLAKERSDPNLAREAFQILATNRAADLREQRTLSWQRDGRLPPRYFQLLTRLRTAEANSILADTRTTEFENEARQARADLGLLETQLAMAFGNSLQPEEKFGNKKTLVDIQQALTRNDALFSFSLGKRRSWLWALTNQSLNLIQLPAGDSLEHSGAEWAVQIRAGRTGCAAGARFSADLLSQVPDYVLERPNWLLVSDGTLLANVPLAALPDPRASRTIKPSVVAVRSMTGSAQCDNTPIVQNHTLRYLSSELAVLLRTTPEARQLSFVGIGDPVYNLADTRFNGAPVAVKTATLPSGTMLARLVGSGTEVRQAAAIFPRATVLTGTEATTDRLPELFDSKPSVVHFAVHVISPPGRPEEAALALSLGRERFPELLTPELVATYRVPGSLVVMNGCDSQQGKAVPGVGVKGLSRAWLLAGAAAVVTSTWPMPDDDGRFFRYFYQQLTAHSDGGAFMPERAAKALADAQNQMRSAGGFRSEPAFWAAYTVISKE
jgi:CHAT domain-containing protein/tetratricopeptide (TPR) repeat protein